MSASVLNINTIRYDTKNDVMPKNYI